ncbi:MAG: hypothetical protein AB7E70_21665 [Hyphomicrobiaceae bacterium]
MRAEARRLFDQGLSQVKIAAAIGVSKGSISGLAIRDQWPMTIERRHGPRAWPPERVAELRRLLVEERLSRVECAERLGCNYRALEWVIVRYGLNGIKFERPRKERKPTLKEMRARGPQPAAKPKAEPIPEGSVATPYTTGCRWIYGEPGRESHWCGKPRLPGRAWRPEHHARCYVPAPANREAA